MKPNYSISIPKPCHEDWSKMTPNEKGRFCKSCSKTVVDFTKMNAEEIQDYIHKNRHQRICGHIKQSQLDTINLRIPETVFTQSLSFNRLFLLALLLTMGITLFNCQDEKGKPKKIESVEIVETHKKSLDTILNEDHPEKKPLDTIHQQRKVDTTKTVIEEHFVPDGLIVIETTGDIDIEPPVKIEDLDSLDIKEPPHCPIPEEPDVVFGLIIENPPEFKDTPKDLSLSEKRKLLSDSITKIVRQNFNQDIADNLNLKGKQKIWVQFTISEKGYTTNIKARGPHPTLEEEAIRVTKLLPQFKPAQQRGRNIASVYSLPIIFIVED